MSPKLGSGCARYQANACGSEPDQGSARMRMSTMSRRRACVAGELRRAVFVTASPGQAGDFGEVGLGNPGGRLQAWPFDEPVSARQRRRQLSWSFLRRPGKLRSSAPLPMMISRRPAASRQQVEQSWICVELLPAGFDFPKDTVFGYAFRYVEAACLLAIPASARSAMRQ